MKQKNKDMIYTARMYWDSFELVDRESVCKQIYVSSELANLKFELLPTHIKSMLYDLWDTIWKYEVNNKDIEL